MWNGISKLDDVKQTIFENIEEDKIKIDLDAFEEDFKEKAIEKKAIAKEVAKKPEKITLIEPKRGKMYDILLAKLKLSSMETIAVSLYTCDEKILSLECLELLIPVIPTEEEVKVCSVYKGDKNLLANPERFILALSVIKGYGNRIRALHFNKTSKDLLEDLEQKAENTEKIWKVILEDKKIHLLFKYILAHGNYMNGTSMRGGMYGFSFDSLEKVVDCRSTNNPKRNLLIYLLEYIHKMEEKSLIEEHFSLFDYDFISKLPVSQLDLDLQEIKKGTKYMDLALNSFSNDPSDQIVEVLKDSYNRILAQISNLDVRIKRINELYQKVQKYLCEDSKETSDKTAKKILFMWQNILNWKKELERKKREEERKKAAALKKNKNMALPVDLKTPVKRAVVNVLDEKNSNLNNLIAGKADPEEIIKDLHERRKAKSKNLYFKFLMKLNYVEKMLGVSLKTAMIAKMMYKKMKKSMLDKKNHAQPLKKETTNDLLKELISNHLKS